VVLTLCVGAFAQGGIGELTGQVTDSTGAVVSGVEVKLTNTATGQVRTTMTTPAGTYRFPALEIVGSYTLEVAAKGFKSVKVQNIIATVGQITTRDVKLEVGAATEQVTVEAGAQLVQTEDSALSQAVDRRVWEDMPLEDRNSNDFIGMLAGAEPAEEAELSTDRGPAVNGTRSGSGNFMVEGFSNNDQGLGGGGTLYGTGGANTSISPDAIEEYRVIEGTPPAEYGQAGGFVTDTVLKGGTNNWHGSLFEYNRIQALAANSWFSDHSGTQDHLIRNQFGGSIGGPIIKDKTFFYFTAEAHRLRIGSPLSVNTTTDQFLNFVNTGAFASFMESNPGGICEVLAGTTCPGTFSTNSAPQAPNSTLGPVFSQEIKQQANFVVCVVGSASCVIPTSPSNPKGNAAGGLWTGGLLGLPGLFYTDASGNPVAPYGTTVVSQPQITNQMRYDTKVDHKIGSKDQINAAYLYDNVDSTVPYGGNNVAGPTEYVHGRAQNAGVTWSHTFSPTILNQARMGYVRHTANFPGDPTVGNMPSTLSALDSPTFGLGNSAAIPQLFTENEFVYKDDLSVTKGKNNFKAGAEYRRTRNGSSFDSYKNGYNLPYDIEDVVTDSTFSNNWEGWAGNPYTGGSPDFGSMYASFASLNPTNGQLPIYYRGFRANEVAMYIQDDWRVHPRLTVNMGLRWEYFGPPHNFQSGLDANFYTGTPVLQANPCPTVSNPAICGGAIANPFWPSSTNGYYAGFTTGAVQQRNHDLWNKDLTNFGPRIGFSYDALGNQKMVVRGGFGINYDRIYNNVFENIRFNPPFFAIGELGTLVVGTPVTNVAAATLVTNPYTLAGTDTFLNYPLTPSIRAMDQNLRTPYYEQAHLGVQYQLGKDFVWESNYVGTFGHQLMDIEGKNVYDGKNVGGPYAASLVNPNYGNISFRTNCCDSNYHAFQTTMRKRFSSGLQFNANYTYAKAMDDVSDAFTTKNVSAAAYPTDSEDPHFDYGPADYNVKHRIVGSFVYDLPFAKTNRWIGGWNVSGIVSWQSGSDFSVSDSSEDSNKDGQFNDRGNYLGSGTISDSYNHSFEPWRGALKPAQWGMLNATVNGNPLPCPATVNMGLWCQGPALGQMERNTLVGPSFFNTDFGVKKTFKITEKAALRFDANFFNLFNHPNFRNPDGNLADGTFGQSTATFNNTETGGPRITQLAVRFDF
ncbi:MAG: carboxypeptidase regulatory-like domain-containing protein, partial [Terriglobales bacterium]